MKNAINSCEVTINTGGPLVKGIDILFKEMEDSIVRVIEKVDKEDEGLPDNFDYTITFDNSKIFTILPQSEILRLYDNVPRLAKAQTLMGNRLVYGNYLEGYDMVDSEGQPVLQEYIAKHITRPASPTVISYEVLSTTLYGLPPAICNNPFLTLKVTFEEFNLNAGDSFTIELNLGGAATGIFCPVDPNVPDSATPESTIVLKYTLTEDFDLVSDMATSQSFINTVGTPSNIGTDPANFPFYDAGIWTNAWNGALQQSAVQSSSGNSYPLTGSGIDNIGEPIEIVSSDSESFTIAFPMPEYAGPSVDYYEFNLKVNSAAISTEEENIQKSLHSNRSYEVGIVYMDEFGRSSIPVVSDRNKINVECRESIFSNRIQVSIPETMRAPYWADRYKFVIKPDRQGYETIYSYLHFSFGGYVYFKLEGEQAAKIEEGDRLVVKADSSGARGTCTYATVLEKKLYAKDEISASDNLPAVGGAYMKMQPNFDVFDIDAGVNVYLGNQTAGTNGGDDQNTENGAAPGDYPVLVYTGFQELTAPPPLGTEIPAGSRLTLSLEFTRQGRGDAACESRTLSFEHTWIADDQYTDIVDWFDNQQGVHETIESVLGESGDPDQCIPRNQVLDATSAGAPLYDIDVDGVPPGPDPCYNYMRFHTAGPHPEFVVTGTNKCSGGFGSGSSPNRRSRVKARWDIIRAYNVFVFETMPQDALPNLWYESSQSFPITNGLYQGNLQDQTATQPAIVNTAFFNCYTYGNGVESYKIQDSIIGKPISLGNRALTTSEQDFKEIRRFADLTYSGVYNDETNINKLNEFNLGLLNFKPLEDIYGPVEKLFGRKTDILTLQEDKISYVLAGKNLLTDSTGESVVTSVPEVLGTQVARTEDYGISNNPESFAEFGSHKFFTDVKRGAVIHLYGDGQNEKLSVISAYGMRSWFRDTFIETFNTQKLGGYDPYMDEYVLAIKDTLLPGQINQIPCGTVQTLLLTPETQTFYFNLGTSTGPCDITYSIIDADDADSATITTTYPYDTGTPVVTGPISNSSQPTVPTVNKNNLVDNVLRVDVDFSGSRRFLLQLDVPCPDKTTLNVVLVTLSAPEYFKQRIHNQYQWSTVDGFVSPITTRPQTFSFGNSGPVVSQFEQFGAVQGGALVPADGSDVTMTASRFDTDNFTFSPARNGFRYLRTNTQYSNTPDDIQRLINDSTFVAPTGAQPDYSGTFAMPSAGGYLYLVWDYA